MHRPVPSKCGTASLRPERREGEACRWGALLGVTGQEVTKRHRETCSVLIRALGRSRKALLVCLVAAATAAPQFFGRFGRPYYGDGRHIAILSQSQEGPDGARFRYGFQTENGINVEARGTPGSKGQSNIDGSFSFPFPEGGIGSVSYVADENGYRPVSPLIPTPHPLPAHAIEQIRFAQSQGRFG
ncbi:hypothetical protein O3P69_019951 [Scylla paramamosain]|uniref:Uncharacterized protein n=1 Tax=Scylla paramamosain TaxID=85552 RepID=A0AAW0SB27_SCYPA